jgi:hypothetical protein
MNAGRGQDAIATSITFRTSSPMRDVLYVCRAHGLNLLAIREAPAQRIRERSLQVVVPRTTRQIEERPRDGRHRNPVPRRHFVGRQCAGAMHVHPGMSHSIPPDIADFDLVSFVCDIRT